MRKGFEKKFSIWEVSKLLLNQGGVDLEIQKLNCLKALCHSTDFSIGSGLTCESVKQIIHDFVHLSNNLEDLLENPLEILSGFNLRAGETSTQE